MNDIYYVETIYSSSTDMHTRLLQRAVDRAQDQGLEVTLDFQYYGSTYATLLTARRAS